MALFSPYRALGYITDGEVPFAVQRRGRETYVTVSVGKAWQVWRRASWGAQRAAALRACPWCHGMHDA